MPSGGPTHLPGSPGARLEALAAQADAFAEHLDLNQAQRAQRIWQRIEIVCDALADLAAAVAASSDLPAATRSEVASAVGALRQALSRPASTNALEVQRRRIAEAHADFDGDLVAALARGGRRLDASLLRPLRRYQHAREALDMEMRVAAVCVRQLAPHRGRDLARRRHDLAVQVERLRGKLGESRARLEEQHERSAAFRRAADTELRSSVEAVGVDLDRLLT